MVLMLYEHTRAHELVECGVMRERCARQMTLDVASVYPPHGAQTDTIISHASYTLLRGAAGDFSGWACLMRQWSETKTMNSICDCSDVEGKFGRHRGSVLGISHDLR